MDADLIFTGGIVLTEGRPQRDLAVVVKGSKVLVVGHADHTLDAWRGLATEVVDLRGRLLIPGFVDAHVHPVWGGLDLLRCNLATLQTREAYLSRVSMYARVHPERPWILGGGWSLAAFPGGTPTAHDLDSVTSGRPAFLTNQDGHGAWVNSAALEWAGIDARTPDPPDGRIERHPDGRPSGTLHEGAMALVGRLVPPTTHDELVQALLLGQAELHRFGVTAWQDAIVGGYGDTADPGPAYRATALDGRLRSRVVGALWWDRARGMEQLDDLRERRATLAAGDSRGGSFRPTSVKIMQDGVAENFTAAMLQPYCDGHGGHTDNSGISFVEPELLREAVTALDADGFQVHFHAIGDRAVRDCLDAVEEARRANGANDLRHHLAHLQVVHPEDIARFSALGVAANLQMLWAALEPQMVDLTLPFLGEPRASWQYPFGDLMRTGATLVAGSDWSVSTPNPLAAIHVGVNRLAAPSEAEGDYPAFLPHQALSLQDAMTAYTAGSAWVNHWDDAGRIAVGCRADLAVLDRDPFAVPTQEIGHTRVLQTYVAGELVYSEH
jgi:predicted amidohydrolase YtcJ